MQAKTVMPANVVTHAAGIETKPLSALVSNNGFDAYFSTLDAHTCIFCHRCRDIQPRQGAISASVEDERGEHVRHYLCATCCDHLREVQQ